MRLAVAGGFRSDRMAFAVASGYQAALRHLPFGIGSHELAAFCVTEAAGAHPRQIQTVLAHGRINGEKRYTSLLPIASTLLVVARRGVRPDGRPDLCVVKLCANAPGVERRPMPPTPFCPELPHGITRMKDVSVGNDMVLMGDGFRDFVKPFRTVEDLHVTGAVAGFLSRQAITGGWPDRIAERLLAVIATLDSLARAEPTTATTHLAVAGTLSMLDELSAELPTIWSASDEQGARRFNRDAPILGLLSKVRQRRRQRAWSLIGRPVAEDAS